MESWWFSCCEVDWGRCPWWNATIRSSLGLEQCSDGVECWDSKDGCLLRGSLLWHWMSGTHYLDVSWQPEGGVNAKHLYLNRDTYLNFFGSFAQNGKNPHFIYWATTLLSPVCSGLPFLLPFSLLSFLLGFLLYSGFSSWKSVNTTGAKFVGPML